MLTYLDLENINLEGKRVGIFGAGRIGSGMAYDLLTCAGIKVDFYFDNKKKVGTVIRDDIKVESLEYLYKNCNDLFIFLAVDIKFQNDILKQFDEKKIVNYIILDTMSYSQIISSVDRASIGIKKKYNESYDNQKFLRRKFKEYVNGDLNFEKPKTFNEKLQWLKIYNHKEEHTTLVDKYNVKKYVVTMIGEKYVIPTIGIWDCFDDIDFAKLPNRFVLKSTHDSGGVTVIKEKNEIQREKLKAFYDRRLATNLYWISREWPYKNVIPKIICEPYICDKENEVLPCYKFFCFGGNVKLVEVILNDKTKDVTADFFDVDWNHLDFELGLANSKIVISRPKCLGKMVNIARILSKGHPFIRVDLFEANKKILFSELTFFPDAGFAKFNPEEWDMKLGEWLKLPVLKEDKE